MTWFFGIVVVLLMGGIALVASGRGAPMVEEYDDRPDALVPATGDLAAADLRRVRFSLAFRGYRMSEVDALLTRLAAQLESQQAEAAWQPGQPGQPGQPTDDPAAAPAESREDGVPPG